MKKNRFLILIGLILLVSIVFVACNKTDSQTGDQNYSKYAGTYYEVVGDNVLDPESWISLTADGKWANADDESGTYTVKNGTLEVYWLLTDECAFDGTIEDGKMFVDILGEIIEYRRSDTVPPAIEDKPIKKNEYTIIFDVEGGDEPVGSMKYEAGAVLSDLPIPTREGYKFLGWKDDTTGKTYDRMSTMPIYNLHLYAQWEKVISHFEDEYVYFKPATEGKKQENDYFYDSYDNVKKYVYVELTSDNIGGRDNVGTSYNFDLADHVDMEYYPKEDGYSLEWFSGDWNTPNGSQTFSLRYGSNINLLAVKNNKGQVLCRYLLDIYVKHDYDVYLYETTGDDSKEPYKSVRVIEHDNVVEQTLSQKSVADFEFDYWVYYNPVTEKYAKYDFTTPMTSDINLYQKFKAKTITANLNGGVLDEEISVTPYENYSKLPVPTKDGHDFIGWQNSKGYFADITGFAGLNELTKDGNFNSLNAVFEKKRYYAKESTDGITMIETVPIVTYTDKFQREICEIVYAPIGEECPLPVKTPATDRLRFDEWRRYNQDKKGAIPIFDFATEITEPIALFAETSSPNIGDTVRYNVPLNGPETRFYGSSSAYVLRMPAAGTYHLRINSSYDLTIVLDPTNLNEKQTYTCSYGVTDIAITVTQPTVKTFIEQNGYSFLASFSGNTGANSTVEEGHVYPVYSDRVYKIGDEITLSKVRGYDYSLSDGTKIEDSFTFAEWTADSAQIATKSIAAEMSNFEFESTDVECKITGIKNKNVTEICVPNYVTEIAEGAFAGCSSLESITIPFVGAKAGVTSTDTYQYPFGYIFGKENYDGSKATSQYYYESSTSSRTKSTFYIPSSLTSVTLTGGNILYGAFYNCTNLTDITIKCDIASIGGSAFYHCSGLTSIAIPDNVTSIGNAAFEYCRGLTSITIPQSVTSIGSSAFQYCYRLVEVYNKSSLTITAGSSNNGYVAYYAKNVYTTEGGSKLSADENGYIIYTDGDERILIAYQGNETNLILPDGITAINKYVFYYCSGLTSVTIGDSVTSVGDYAFYECSGLTSIIIPDSVTSIGQYAFYNCTGLTSVTIGDSVTSIGDYAFYNCYRLVEVCNKSSLTITAGSSGNGYVACYAKNVYTEAGEGKLSTDDNGYVIYIDETEKILVSYIGSDTELSLPNGITAIDESAFSNCTGLTSITIPDSVTSIGNSAFSGCTGLTSITIGNGVTSIGNSTFFGCTGLTSITIPDSVTSIGGSAFYDCSGLMSVTIPDSVTSIGQYAFYDCSGLTSVTIGNGVTSIGYSAFYGCTGLTSITLPESVISIGSSAFKYCRSLTSITLPDSVTSIGGGAFESCSSLTSITLPFVGASATASNGYDQVFGYIFGYVTRSSGDKDPYLTFQYESDSTYYFYGIPSSLKEVVISGAATHIPEKAFYNCNRLTSMTLPFVGASATASNGYDQVFGYIFGYYTTSSSSSSVLGARLQYYSYPSYGYETYYYYYIPSNIRFITIAGRSIPSRAFYNCTGLTSVTIGNNVTSIGSSAFYNCVNIVEVYNKSSLTITAGSSDNGGVARYAKNVYTEEGESKLSTDENGYVIYTDGAEKILVSYIGSGTELSLPKGITSNYSCAFQYNSDLTSITLSDSVTRIAGYTFLGCTSLTSVTISKSVTSIGAYIFSYCSKMTRIDFQGTKAEWGNISKHTNWKNNSGSFVVYCTDGTIEKSNA